MLWWPYHEQTWVLPLDALEARELIAFHTQGKSATEQDQLPKGKVLFTGSIEATGPSTIARKVDYPENALPNMQLGLTDTPRGCILSITYRLFLSSAIFLSFWSLISLLTAGYLWWGKDQTLMGGVALTAGLLNYFLFMVSYNRQIKKCEAALQEVFEDLSLLNE